ncbi:serine/threonine phosphatase stp [Clostridium acetireducens DSM 10703]|jgi:serine/threonine protein phosphatase PrpC|uniref:protein-serine/threonine phosphatase n=1 Tax=Clostridium acetireducens DSM 10703 TaxID=1121290 RepID=A0A1E8F2Q8_9CLOT|nr:Stp1/IreP family PP2C-type Ser/Thr phosphatase [Clostridium acetireducens]OFI07673.1 serine/threonine phosphatase stp [Clostridium acetireducens DSM 10703]
MVGILSDVGNVRSINEDSVGYFKGDNKSIYVIADGMGGHNAGEVASKIAVDTTINYIKTQYKDESVKDMKYILIKGIECANKKIYDLAQSNKSLKGMGTTITACLIKESTMLVANVGDSRCYVIKDNKIVKVTKDHSLVQQLVDNGSISEEEAIYHPNKNVITRALGTNKIVDIDVYKIDLKDIKKVILCTDGLTNEVTTKEIENIVTNNDNEKSCRELIKLSKLKGGRDNISVIVFEGECKDDR